MIAAMNRRKFIAPLGGAAAGARDGRPAAHEAHRRA